MNYTEAAFSFPCNDEWLVGIASLPEQSRRRGVLVVVGGPQYRVGSHRQFALLARNLAAQGIPVLRFDYRGMGDSESAARTFEQVGDDLRAAIDHFIAMVPGLAEVVIWGLCDAASAALFYANSDTRVCGLVLLNPWVRTDTGLAKATLKHYYRDRLLQPALWKKVISGRFNYKGALSSFSSLMATLIGNRAVTGTRAAAAQPLPDRMLAGLGDFKGNTLLILSGNDLTAREFCDLTTASRQWQALLGSARVTRKEFAEADHTFSRRAWRDQVASWTGDWIKSW
jgi:exosortase A-associated hydrolase 1